MAKKTKKKKKRFTANELKALELVAKHPEKSDADISKDLVKLGNVIDPYYLNKRTNANVAIRDKIAIKREKNLLRIQNQMPLALKVSKNHLKSNNLDAAKLVMKHALPVSEDAPVRQPTVSVETLTIIQNNQLQVCQDRLDAIKVEESSNDNE